MAEEQKRWVVYQVVNLDAQELFFGHTDIHLEKEIAKIARDRKGPTRDWRKGDTVHWRPLTDMISKSFAQKLHKQFESKSPPNKFAVISTFKEEG